jgi:hypothetical protein
MDMLGRLIGEFVVLIYLSLVCLILCVCVYFMVSNFCVLFLNFGYLDPYMVAFVLLAICGYPTAFSGGHLEEMIS